MGGIKFLVNSYFSTSVFLKEGSNALNMAEVQKIICLVPNLPNLRAKAK